MKMKCDVSNIDLNLQSNAFNALVVDVSEKYTTSIAKICLSLRKYGIKSWIFGGAARAIINGEKCPNDFDMCCDASFPEIVSSIQNEIALHRFEIHRNQNLGFIGMGIKKGVTVDINILRDADSMAKYVNTRAEIQTSRSLDLHARTIDFGMNAIFIDTETRKVIDPTNSLEKIASKQLEWIKDPNLTKHSYNNSFRVAKFIARGYIPAGSAYDILQYRTDIEIQTFGIEKSVRWIYFQIIEKNDGLDDFKNAIMPYIRDNNSRQIMLNSIAICNELKNTGKQPNGRSI